MDYVDITTETLKNLHGACTKVYQHDRTLSEREKKLAEIFGDYFGVDEYPDWNEHVRRIEGELSERKQQYVPIVLQ